ncbi:hypothetical protein [Methylobacterium sp. ARG-1]|uniref:hypothetical protein n=1 Tax=Methylobacterium sp. ARG-1 TaxID=1692501 RepID=UPI000683010B|nr:hypothetical protein [Methylobacterium sp. ARG-1]KNY21068.1 hypothetical protein AKJ13_18890 [Methylobacterium sp. ARG-1]
MLEQQDQIFELNERVRRTVDFVLDLSANLSVLSESGWPETHLWLERALPIIAHDHVDWLESRFKTHLRAAEATLARQVPIRLSDYRTAASPRDMAHSIGITTHVLRVAKANKCGLTSIDPEPKKERDRRNAEKARRDRGQKLRTECTKDAEFRELAQDLDCHVSTLYRHDKAGNLDAYVTKRRAKLGL